MTTMKTLFAAALLLAIGATQMGGCGGRAAGSTRPLPPAPATFTLLLPANSALDVDPQTTFSWSGSYGADSYRLQVSTNAAFTSIVVDRSGIVSSSLTLSPGLDSSTQFYWRVYAENRSGSTLAIPVSSSFTTRMTPPTAFDLLDPWNEETDVDPYTWFSWEDSDGVATYTLQYSRSATFPNTSETVTVTGLVDSDYDVTTPLAPMTVYYWRVYAINGAGQVRSNTEDWFVTDALLAPEPFNLTSPANGSVNVAQSPTLSWSASANANTYTVEISTTTSFSTPAFRYTGITTTSYRVPAVLTPQRTFYWRALAVNAVSTTTSTQPYWSFTTTGTIDN